MAKTDKITLAGREITIHALNLAELQKVSAWFAASTNKDKPQTPDQQSDMVFNILALALARAEPKLSLDSAELDGVTPDEVRAASEKILTLAGLAAPNPTPAAAPPAN